MCQNVFNVWPKTMLLPVWPRDARRLNTPGGDTAFQVRVREGDP